MRKYTIKIKAAKDEKRDLTREIATVFVNGYKKDLSFFTNSQEKLVEAFQQMIHPNAFYCATLEGEIVGILACSNNKERALTIDKDILRNSFGYIKGTLAYYLMKNEFNKKLDYSNRTGYIESVATTVKAQGKGVSTALMNNVLENGGYDRYILEVVDTNEKAHRLYKKIGFKEYKRKKESFSKFKGFKYRIYMEYEVDKF